MTIGRNRAWMILLGLGVLSVPALSEPLVAQKDLEKVGFQLYWEADLPMSAGDSLVAAYLRDEVLYVVSDFGRLFSVVADSGLLRWANDVTEADYVILPPTHIVTVDGTGPVMVATGTETFVYDRYTGRQVCRFTPAYTTAGPGVAVDDLVLAGGGVDRFYASQIDLRYGHEPRMVWEVATDGPITASPVLFDKDYILFASRRGTVYACRTIDKRLRFRTYVGGSIIGDPVVDATGVYVASTDRSLYKLDLTEGRIQWRVRFETPLNTGPIVTGGTLYQASDRAGLTAIEPDTGAVRWRVADAHDFASHSQAGDVLVTADRNLLVVDHDKGEPYATVPTSGVEGVVRNAVGDAVFLIGRNGTVDTLRIGNVPFLKRQQIMAARRKLNQRPVEKGTNTEQAALPQPKRDRRSDDPLRSKRDINE